jgi:hypothetical protein
MEEFCMATTNRAVESTLHGETVPYPPSWFDRLLVWIEELPGPEWLFYTSSLVVIAIVINAVFWIDGSAPFGYFDPFNTTFSFFVIYWPALYRYLTRVGSRSLRSFRPLLKADEAEIDRIDYEITTLPQSVGLLAIPLGFGLAILTIVTDPQPYGDIIPRTLLPYIGDIAISGFMITAFFCLLIRSIRQLRMVAKLHSQVMDINLMELAPAHAFADLTARTGIGLILVLIVSYPADPLAYASTLNVLLFIITGLLAVGIFVLPVIGMQGRIEEEKARTMSQTNRQLQAARDRLHSQVRSEKYEGMGEIKDAIEALMHERELIKGISTWPWNTKTIRSFASALLLPLFLGLVTRLFEKLL